MKASMLGATLVAAAALIGAVSAHAASDWVAVEHDPARITSYDRASIGHYDNNNPDEYFPKGDAIRGVIIKLKYLDTTPVPGEPNVDQRLELTLFNCDAGTNVSVWVALSYRGVPVGNRAFAPAVQLRTGFQPVIDQWNGAGSAIDKIYHAICSAKIEGREDFLVQ